MVKILNPLYRNTLVLINIHEKASEIIFIYDHWMKTLLNHIINDITICNNNDLYNNILGWYELAPELP